MGEINRLIEDLGGLDYLALMCNAREFDIRQRENHCTSVGTIRFKVGWNNSTCSVLIVYYGTKWIWTYGLIIDPPESHIPWQDMMRFNTLSDLDYNFHALTGLHLTNHFTPMANGHGLEPSPEAL